VWRGEVAGQTQRNKLRHIIGKLQKTEDEEKASKQLEKQCITYRG